MLLTRVTRVSGLQGFKGLFFFGCIYREYLPCLLLIHAFSCQFRPRRRQVVAAVAAAMISARVVLAVVFVAFVFSLHSLKYCFNCNLLPGRELTASKCAEYNEPYESKASLAFAGSTRHTIEIEDTNGDVNCWAACSLGLRRNCSEPGQRVCPSDLCTPAKPTVAFQDLTEGEYTVSVNCEEAGTCYAEPKEFTFLVQQQAESAHMSREIPLTNIKLHKESSGRCSNEKVWRSRITCFAVLETLMGVLFLLISLREKKQGERMPPFFLEDKKWVLQSKSRS